MRRATPSSRARPVVHRRCVGIEEVGSAPLPHGAFDLGGGQFERNVQQDAPLSNSATRVRARTLSRTAGLR
jgi:hypothetical protein